SGNGWEPMVTEDKYVGGRHYRFHHQSADWNLGEVWSRVAATRLVVGGKDSPPKGPGGPLQPRVLSIWGVSDWQGNRASSAWIAEVVNRVRPGNGPFVGLDSIAHGFLRAASPEESYRRFFKPAKEAPPAEFNPVILETVRAWLDETAGRAKRGPEKPPNESRPVRGDPFTGMDPYIHAAMEKWEVPGLAIAVVKNGETVLARG